jgi:hypothetical protein
VKTLLLIVFPKLIVPPLGGAVTSICGSAVSVHVVWFRPVQYAWAATFWPDAVCVCQLRDIAEVGKSVANIESNTKDRLSRIVLIDDRPK